MNDQETNERQRGSQRLSPDRLQRWQKLEYGMFLHYGMATFAPDSTKQSRDVSLYDPTDLDVDQWVQVARDAGMKYIILTAKHIRGGGFSIWPSEQTDYSVANAPDTTDVVGEFVKACEKHNIRPALYLGGDRHNVPSGLVLGPSKAQFFYVTHEYMDFTLAQLEELLTWYGPIEEIWLDGPQKYGTAGRREISDHIASFQPKTVVAMNGDWEDDGKQPQMKPYAWPSDVIVIEAGVPPIWGTDSWRNLPWDPAGNAVDAPLPYYLPVENCTIAHRDSFGWWWGPGVKPRSIEELLGVRLLCHARNANCVFNLTPNREGKIPDDQAAALFEVRDRWQSLGLD
ncbi:MAG: alpha-L-fucosidase [Planctomycetes bacterium]|nr:alpha-L-fucosidase [Planctomycetota bacterium]